MKNTACQEMDVLAAVLFFYEKCLNYFGDEKELSIFLEKLISAKQIQIDLLKEVCEVLKKDTQIKSQIIIDEEISCAVKDAIQANLEKLDEHRLSSDDLIVSVIAVETSFWNEIFLYLIGFVKDKSVDNNEALMMIRRIERDIRKFVKSLPNAGKYFTKTSILPQIWRDKILVVDDDPVIRYLFEKFLEDDWDVFTAADGREALECLAKNYFDIIISDISMPIMSGLKFFREAIKIKTKLARKIIFVTGACQLDEEAYIAQRQIKMLYKPISIKELKDVIQELLVNE